MRPNQRTLLLAGILLVVFVFVIGDMLLRARSQSQEGTPTDRAAALTELRTAIEEKRHAVDAADRIAADARRINELWAEAIDGMVKAQTASLAQSSLREHVLRTARDAAPEAQAGVPRFAESPVDGAPGIRRLSLDLSLTATSPADLFSIIDRIENDATIRMGITRISMEGPGMQQGVVRSVTATLAIEALAVIGGDGA
ncbi:MAG: hypothetical protein EA380_06285 [Phycisphaeraceae bacterium]|nr:MAG: hypothetical protein EA380_06285 [Phycisphaeraceae bacterium]